MIEGNGPGAVALGTDDRVAATAAVKVLLRVQTTGEDALIASFTETALGLAEQFTGQVTIARTMTERLRAANEWQRLAATPVRVLTSVGGTTAAGALTSLSPGDYAIDIDPEGDGWLRVGATGFARVTAVFSAGLAEDWAGLPAPIRQGAVMLAAHLFTTRDLSEPGAGGGPPAAVTALWRPFRALRLARAVRAVRAVRA